MSRFRRGRLSVRAQRWGQFTVVEARGNLNVSNSAELTECVLKIRGAQPVILDLCGVTRFDLAGITAVRDIRQLLQERAWALAIVADPSGPCAKALEGDPDPIRTCPDRHAARSTLHHAAL